MQITMESMLTGNTSTMDIDVTLEQLEAWHNGMLIKEAMPHLTTHEREFIKTGITQEEWDTAL
jgi:hypothetical protein